MSRNLLLAGILMAIFSIKMYIILNDKINGKKLLFNSNYRFHNKNFLQTLFKNTIKLNVHLELNLKAYLEYMHGNSLFVKNPAI